MIKKQTAVIFLGHFLLNLLIQIEILFSSYKAPFWKVLGSQFENILVSLILSLIFIAIRKSIIKRRFFYFSYFILLIFISMNQIFFQIFHENFAFTFTDGFKLTDFSNYWGSFEGELKPFHFLNALFLTTVAVLIFKLKISSEKYTLKLEKFIFPALLTITAFIQYSSPRSEVNHHLLFTAFRGMSVSPQKQIEMKKVSREKLYQLTHGIAASEQASIHKKNLELLSKKKNVIFIILESVGSMQILNKDKEIDSKNFPFLSKNKKNLYIFPTVHNNFPGTTRSHIPLMTGGLTLTWGSVFKELLYPYQGPTLVSEFKSLGKKTALISAMGLDFENLSSFYNNLGFDYFYDSDRETTDFKKANRIHSWGVDEKVTLNKFSNWIDKIGKSPFFLQLLTNTTHHPYGAPKDFNHGVSGDDNYSKYKMSLRYTDSIISNLVAALKKKELLEDTIIYISGDHGEAFGKYHKNNFAHKSSVYEETIKNFLIVFSPSGDIHSGISKRRGSLGDILPTLLSPFKKIDSKDLIGQSLFASDYKEQAAYFHKNTYPEIWGLRDGNWKYSEEKVGGGNPHLYDLKNDPFEKNNLINKYSERKAYYQLLITNWFVQTNDSFVKNLKGYKYIGDGGLSLTDVNSYGPKRIAIGIKPKGLNFTPLVKIHPEESMTVWTHGVSYPKATKIRYEFKSPSGKKHGFKFKHKSDWSTVYVYDRPKKPREEGIWRITLYEPLKNNSGEKEIISTIYKVSKDESLNWSSVDKSPGIRKLSFGIKKKDQDFQELEVINPKERMAVFSIGIPFKKKKELEFDWISPSGKVKNFSFTIKSGWHSTWIYHDQEGPMEPGEWTLNIREDKTLIKSGKFKVDSTAPLHIPLEF